jgi:hypothetical protein
LTYWTRETDRCALRARTSQEFPDDALPCIGDASSRSPAFDPPAAKLLAKFFCSRRHAELHSSFTSFIIAPP